MLCLKPKQVLPCKVAEEAPTNVAGYFRVSLARDDMHAPQIYQGEIERYCNYKNWALKETFSDIDLSGYVRSPVRPGLEELKRRRTEFEAVVVPKLSRFSRSMSELIRLFDFFEASGVSLVFLDLNVDMKTSQGRLLRNIMAAFAEHESAVKGDYARANHRHAAQAGKPHYGTPPMGYRLENKTFLLFEPEAEIIREIFARYLAGESQLSICRTLHTRGTMTNTGRVWTVKRIGRILDNPTYAGLRVMDERFFQGTWESIIDDATWTSVREKRKRDVRIQGYRRPKAGPYLLTSLMECGVCGDTLSHACYGAKPSSARYECPRKRGVGCRGGSIRRPRADAFVAEAFLKTARFAIVDTDAQGKRSYRNPRTEWASANIHERRQLLSLAISRVVLLPHPPDDPNGSRELAIEWRHPDEQLDRPVFLIAESVEPQPKGPVEWDAVTANRRLAVKEVEKEKAARRERARQRTKDYYRDWKAVMRQIRAAGSFAEPNGRETPEPKAPRG